MNRLESALNERERSLLGPRVQLARDLARRLDRDAEAASDRLLVLYGSVLRQLDASLERLRREASAASPASGASPSAPAPRDALSDFRARHLDSELGAVSTAGSDAQIRDLDAFKTRRRRRSKSTPATSARELD